MKESYKSIWDGYICSHGSMEEESDKEGSLRDGYNFPEGSR